MHGPVNIRIYEFCLQFYIAKNNTIFLVPIYLLTQSTRLIITA